MQARSTDGSAAGFDAVTVSGNRTYNIFNSGGAAVGAKIKYLMNENGNFILGKADDTFSVETQQLVILNNGNVGIGTTSPTRLLQVAGAMKITPTANPGTPTAGDIYIDSAASNSLKYHNGSSWQTLTGGGATNIDGLSDAKADYPNGNIFIGTSVGGSGTGTSNTAMGKDALVALGVATDGTAIGANAMKAVTSGAFNTALGSNAMMLMTTGGSNVAIGANAMRDGTGGNNTFVGGSAGLTSTGSNNTVIGWGAGANGAYSGSVMVGYGNGNGITTGTNNQFFGYLAGGSVTSGSRNVVLGYDSEPPSATASDQLSIGNLIYGTGVNGTGGTISTGNIGIGTSAPTRRLHVAGAMKIDPSVNPASPLAGDIYIDSGAANALKYHNGSAWVSLTGSGGTVAGSTTQIQYNNAGAFGASAAFHWNNTMGTLGVGTTAGFSSTDYSLMLNKTGGTVNKVQLMNSTSGSAASTDGLELSLIGADAALRNYENGYLSVHTNNTERMRILANGNIGIGTTNPTNALEVSNAGGTAYVTLNPSGLTAGNAAGGLITSRYINAPTAGTTLGRIGFSGGTQSVAYMSAVATQNQTLGSIMGTRLDFFTAPNGGISVNRAMTIDQSGFVGIGTTTPGVKLDVDGDIRTINSGTVMTDVVQNAGGSTYMIAMQGSNVNIGRNNASAEIGFWPGNTEKVRFTSGGNVGIGTTAPGRLLHVSGPMRLQPAALPGTPAAGDIAIDSAAANALKFYDGTAWVSAGGSGGITSSGTTNYIPKFTGANAVGNSLLYESSGKIGVGTTSPESKLSLVDNVATSTGVAGHDLVIRNTFDGDSADASLSQIFLRSGTATGNSGKFLRIAQESWGGNPSGAQIYSSAENSSFGIYQQSSTGAASTFFLDGTNGQVSLLSSTRNNITAASGTAAESIGVRVSQPSLSAQNSSVTTTNAYSLAVEGAPLKSTNNTATNAIALGVKQAAVGAHTRSYGLWVNAQTGATNNHGAVFAGGNVGIGITDPQSLLHVAGTGSLINTTEVRSDTIEAQFSLQRARDNAGAYEAIADGDALANILFRGHNGTGFATSARIGAVATDNFASNRGTDIVFSLTPDGSTSVAEKIRFMGNGNVGIGVPGPTRLLHVAGAMKIAPTANPGTPTAGDIFVDSTAANVLKYHNGSAWVTVSGGGASLVVAPSTTSLIGGSTAASLVTTAALDNTAFGYRSMDDLTTGAYNTAVGFDSLRGLTSGNLNVAIGNEALFGNTTGSGNVAVGVQTLQGNGFDNTAVGYWAARSGGGFGNTALGRSAFYTSSSGDRNTALGSGALFWADGAEDNTGAGFDSLNSATTGSRNTAIGRAAGFGLTTGQENIMVGFQAGDNLTTGNNNIVIGYDIDAPAVGSNQILNIGNLIWGTGLNGTGLTMSTGNIGIGVSNPSEKLEVNGNVKATELLLSSDRNLKTDIQPLQDMMEKIMYLQGVSYYWDREKHPSLMVTDEQQLGFIAQEVEKVFPQLVHGTEGKKSVNYVGLIAPMVQAMQQQQKTIESQQRQIDDLKKAVEELRKLK